MGQEKRRNEQEIGPRYPVLPKQFVSQVLNELSAEGAERGRLISTKHSWYERDSFEGTEKKAETECADIVSMSLLPQ